MSYKKSLVSFALGTCLISSAVADISGNIGVTSNYLWRGVTQTADAAAVSGGVDFSADNGLYAGTWISNVEGGNEADFYFGYGTDVNNFAYAIGVIHYLYTQAEGADFTEIHGDVELGLFSAGLYYTISADNESAEDNLYAYVGLSVDLEQDWNLAFTVGHNEPDEGDDYQHVQIDLNKILGDYGDFTLTLSQNNIDQDDDPIFAVSWAKSF